MDLLRPPEDSALPPRVEAFLRDTNPWWAGQPWPAQPPYRRQTFATVLRKLDLGLAPIVVLRGPRQVGKSTLQLQLLEFLLKERQIAPQRILRVQFDEMPSLAGVGDPISQIVRWFTQYVPGRTLNELAREGTPAYLFFDEVQDQYAWAPQLKSLVDHHTVKVMVTGSSALRIQAGHDSLAGRVTTVDLGTLRLPEVAALGFGEELPSVLRDNGLEPLLHRACWRELQAHGVKHRALRDRAFTAFARRGGYPVAHLSGDLPWPELADQLNENVVRRVISHDLRHAPGGSSRDAPLLEAAFRIACRYAGQSPGQALCTQAVRQALGTDYGWIQISNYLRLLDDAMVVRLVEPLEARLRRRRGYAKFCLCDHALRAAWLQEYVAVDELALAAVPHLRDLAGHLAESIVGSFLAGLPHLDLAHFPQREAEPEVDFILTIGAHRIPLEVKYRQQIDSFEDTYGLRAFLEKTAYNAPFGILVTMADDVVVDDPRIVAVSLPSLLLLR